MNGAKVKSCETPLMLAAKAGHVDVLRVLLATGRINVDAGTMFHREKAIHRAASNGHLDVVMALLEVEGIGDGGRTGFGLTALHYAVLGGYIMLVNALLRSRRFDVNEPTSGAGYTTLHLAVRENHLLIIEALLQADAIDATAMTNIGFNALHMSAALGRFEILEMLLQFNPAGIQTVIESKGLNLVHLAAGNGHLEILTMLLATGKCDVNATTQTGLTALHLAVNNGHLDIVNSLLTIDGININAVAKNWLEPFGSARHAASTYGHEIIDSLDIGKHFEDIPHHRNFSAMHVAVLGECFEIVKALLATNKIDLNIEDREGNTVLSLVRKSGTFSPDVVAAIESYHAHLQAPNPLRVFSS